MKLTDLVKKESERVKEKIELEAPKKVFKKERIWLEEKPLENHQEINNQKSIHQSIINQSSNNNQTSRNDLKNNKQPLGNPSNKTSINHQEINNQKSIKQDLTSVVGNEADLLAFIVEECSKKRELKTSRITTDILKMKFSLNANGIANLIFRVKEKGLLDICEQKLGRVSYRVFSVPKDVYNYYLNPENHQENIKKPLGKPLENPSNLNSYSSSIDLDLIKKELITIPANLKAIISQREIQSLVDGGSLEEDVRLSLEHFSYDYEHNLVKSKGNPVGLLFGLLRSQKRYKSLKLIEQENEDLKSYQRELEKLEKENKELKAQKLQENFKTFLAQNPKFLEEVKAEQKFTVSSQEVLENLAFEKFKELGI